MFTGIVQSLGFVRAVRAEYLEIALPDGFAADLAAGESISVNGVCLTVRQIVAPGFAADVSRETAARTTLGSLRPGVDVNLERSVRPGDRLDGHWVLGHVDTVSRVRSRVRDGSCWTLEVDLSPQNLRYVAEKGSIAIDGISLTPFRVTPGGFRVAVIPETFERTVLKHRRPGDRVNLEFDILAKYVERMMQRVHND